MIKQFSSFDSRDNVSFGKHPVKNIDETCYAVGAVHEEQGHNLRQCLEQQFGYLPQNDVLIMESLSLIDETFEEFAKQRKCKTSATVNPDMSSSAISSIVPVEQPVPLAFEIPGGQYVDLSQESPKDAVARVKSLRRMRLLLRGRHYLRSVQIYPMNLKKCIIGPLVVLNMLLGAHLARCLCTEQGGFMFLADMCHHLTCMSVQKFLYLPKKEVYRVLDVSNSAHNKKDIIDYKNVRVKFGSLGSSLRPGGKVETYVVNALCQKIFDKLHARRSFKHFFFTPVSLGFFVE